MKSLTLEFTAWEPDGPKFGGTQLSGAWNVLPAKKGFRPLRDVVPMTGNMPDPPIATYGFRDMNGVKRLAAAAETDVYAWEAPGGEWQWVSKLTTTNAQTTRCFAHYGLSLYCLFGSALYKADCSSTTMGAFSAVSGAPGALTCAVVRDFLVLGDLSSYPNGIQWSAIDDPDSWPTVGTDAAIAVQSDRQVFPEGGKVQAIVPGVGGLDALVFLENGVQRMQYVNAPYIFQFDWADRTHGAAAPRAVVSGGGTAYFIAEDGFYATDGGACRPIGRERVDRWFLRTADPARFGEIEGAWDPQNGLAVWRFASTYCPAGETDTLVMYSPLLDKWTAGRTVTRLHGLVQNRSDAVTLEGLSDLFPGVSLDALPISLDSPDLMGGSLALMAVNGQDSVGPFAGKTLEARLTTTDAGGQRIFVHGVKPLVDHGDAKAQVSFRTRQKDYGGWTVPSAQNREGICPCRASGQYASAQVTIPAGSEWDSAVGCVVLYEEEGGF